MKQRWLPGFSGPEEEPTAWASDEGAELPPAEAPAIPVLPGQFGLFTPERQLLGLLESAVLDGRFEEARAHRDDLAVREGASRDTRDFSVLDDLGTPAFWGRAVEECLDAWASMDRDWHPRPAVRAQVHEGFLRRATAAFGAPTIVWARPTLLAPVVNFLGSRSPAGQADAARSLLREALARGLAARSGEFDDPAAVDLLSEDRSPRWLACIGALTRLWAVPSLEPGELESRLPPLPPEEDEEARGDQFWLCLRMAVSLPRESAGAAEARKRMKVLDPALHAQFMRQGVARE